MNFVVALFAQTNQVPLPVFIFIRQGKVWSVLKMVDMMDCDSPGVSPSCFTHLAFILIQLQYLCPFSLPGCRLIELDPAVILLSSYPHESHHLIRSSTISRVSSLVIPPMPVLSGYRMMTTSKSDSSIFASHGSSTDLSESLPCISSTCWYPYLLSILCLLLKTSSHVTTLLVCKVWCSLCL